MAKTIKPAQKKKRKQSKLPWLFWFVGVLAIAIWWSLYQSKWFITEKVTIQGVTRLTVDQVSAIAAVPVGEPLMSQDLAGINQRLTAIPEIKTAVIERGWPKSLLITITERVPIAVAATAGGFNLIDDEGKNSGVVAAPPPGLLVIAAQPDSPAMVSAIAVLAAIPADWQVTGLTATSQDNVFANLASGAVVTFGSGEQAEKKVQVANALLKQSYLTINVSAPDAPSAR
jgi:cell division protein FtsQ